MLKKALFIAGVVAVTTGVLALVVWGMLVEAPDAGERGNTLAQSPAPDFTLPLFEGADFVLREHLGGPVVIHFWNYTCTVCWREAPVMERVWRAYANRGVTFVGVSLYSWGTERDARAFIRNFDITYPNGPDADGRIARDYNVVNTPVTFFVDGEGVIVRRFVGALPEKKLKSWIENLLADAPSPDGAEAANLHSSSGPGRESG